jgi:hypothetical protein
MRVGANNLHSKSYTAPGIKEKVSMNYIDQWLKHISAGDKRQPQV